MKKNIKFLFPILLFLLLFVAALTNPNKDFHKINIKLRVYKELNIDTTQKASNNIFDFFSEISNSFGKSMVDKTVDELLQVDDYFFFSLTKINYQGQTKIIGIGAFYQIFLFVNLKELIESQKNANNK